MTKRVLIVDDDADIRTLLVRLLSPLAEILEASDAAEALDLFAKQRPRVVLLDVSMPGTSGLEVLEAARRLDPSAVFVMLTSHHDLDVARRSLDLGAAAYVTKPFDCAYIRSEVSRLLSAGGEPPKDRPWKVVE